jgi:phosphatidylserine/phosphatidylglycerophosphate/cardiolipin synthase-like enzyme/radical SAM superfamily enzyme YgiQ (UPF0313 family)
LKIGFIAPALDLDREQKGERIFLLPPLTFPVLAALTPNDIEIEIVEERLRSVNYNSRYDLVGLTFVTAFAPRAYQIGDEFRQRGTTVVMGGPHASVQPNEALLHADAVVIGEAEETWPLLLQDFRKGKLKRIYKSNQFFNIENFPRPRLDILPRQFTFRNATLTSKGCPHQCNFCFTNWINGYRQRFRPISEVVKDLETMEGNSFQRKHFVFWDDNLVGNKSYTKALFRAITPLRKKWAAATSVNIASDPELLALAAKSGCTALFIGMESVNSESLKASHKYHNHVYNYREMIKRLHDSGIGITGAFVFGFDQDDQTIFDRTFEFCQKIELDCMTPAILTPLPGTPLYQSMEKEGRIFDRDWAHYDYFHVVFAPRKMTPQQLYQGFLEFNQHFFSFSSIFKRLSHSRTQLILAILANLGYHRFYHRMYQEFRSGTRGSISPEKYTTNSGKLSSLVNSQTKDSVINSEIFSYNTTPTTNKLRVLIDAQEIFPYVNRMISRARKRIYMEMYLLEGEIGKTILNLLEQKAKEGIETKVLYQSPSSFNYYTKFMSLLHKLGIKSRIKQYQTYQNIQNDNGKIDFGSFPLHLFSTRWPLKMAHNKLLIIDGQEVMLGGMNFASITQNNHDVMVVAQGPIASEIEKVFSTNWNLACGNQYNFNENNQCATQLKTNQNGEALVQYLVTLPYLKNTKAFLLEQIYHAEKRICVEMYLLSDSDLISALIDANRKGCKVQVILDANRLPLELNLHGFPNKRAAHLLLQAGIPVRIYQSLDGQEMHMKMALFDGHKIFLGSHNWTYGSFIFNSEGSFFIQSRSVFAKCLNLFEEDWYEHSHPARILNRSERFIAHGIGLIEHFF